MKYKHIFFDLDGTLTDSAEGIINSGKYALEHLGIAVPEIDIMKKMVGPPLGISFRLFGVPEDQIEEAIRLYRVSYIELGGKYQNAVYPDIENLLQKLKDLGVKMYVATSKPEILAKDILNRFQLDVYFEYIAGATMDHSRESKSEVIKYLLEIISDTDDSVMVGDTEFDVSGAREQGIPCVGVSWGYGSCQKMKSAGAIRVIDSPASLFEFLTNE